MDIKGRTVFVAGATSGLGLGVARHFAGRGANVVLVGRRRELAEQLAGELGEAAIGCGADIADAAHVAAAIQAAVDRFGTIDINVNTAGVQGYVPLVGSEGPTDVADFTRIWSNNVVGKFNV